MNWEAISAIGQIVGAIGVVVSLIYVATEVRNSARATQLASRRSISEIFTLLSRQLAEHPDLRELYYRGLHDFESLEGTDLVGFAQVMLQLFRAYEEAVLPLLPEFNGRLERRLRNPDGTVEMHIVSYASDADRQNYRNDPRRAAQAWLLEKSSAKLELLPMANVS